jgi:23S rRNA (uracil1939-C5)-methyltransferase
MNALCRHFGTCGGCAFQDLSADTYRERKHVMVTKALARHGIEAPVAPSAEVAPATRRRATWKAAKKHGAVFLGFSASRSHDIVDLSECLVLTPTLVALVPALRKQLQRLLEEGDQGNVHVTETDSGIDIALSFPAKNTARQAVVLAPWADRHHVARISVNGDVAVQLATPATRFGRADVFLPPGAFLQPSREGERVLQIAVMESLSGAHRVADLFAGCGTFTLPLAERASVHAVDMDAQALEALDSAARKTKGLKPVTTEARDLFKRPLRPEELNQFEAVVIDPPRAGARAQAEIIAASRVGLVAYVSCNPERFARDASILTKQGFRLSEVKPVDQFLWSKHIELVGTFERQPRWSQQRKN